MTLPFDLEAEKSVLGAILRDPAKIDDVRPLLTSPEDFYQHSHRVILAAVYVIADRAGNKAVDLVTLSQELKDKGKVEEVSTAKMNAWAYLSELLLQAPTAANAVHYARIVKSMATRRALYLAAERIKEEALNPSDPENLLDMSEKAILEIREKTFSSIKTLDQCFHAVADRVDGMLEGKKMGIKTGLLDLDDLVILKPEDLIIVAARTSVGKSIIGGQVSLFAAQEGYSVFFCSVEMPGVDIGGRLLSAHGSVDSGVTGARRLPSEQESRRMAKTMSDLSRVRFFVDDSPQQSVAIIAANARRLHRQHPLGLLVVDYLQLLQVERSKGQTRAEALGEVSRGLKRIARELHIPVMALAQLNRSAQDTDEPELHHIRESGDIEQDADQVWLLWKGEKDDKMPDQHLIHLKVAKQRNGPCGKINLFHRREFMRLENYCQGFTPQQPSFLEDQS